MWLLRVLVGALAALGVAIAVAPESPSKPSPPVPVRIIAGHPGELALGAITERDRSVPASRLNGAQARLLRSWTAEHGVQPLELEFGPISRAPYLGIVYQGAIFDSEGQNALYLRCSNEGRVRAVSVGGDNTTVTETIVKLEPAWCADGEIYLRMVGGPTRNIGVAAPVPRSALAYLKQSYLGYVGFFLTGFGVLLSVFFTGGLVARRFTGGLDPVLGGLLAVGAASLTAFYVYAWTPTPAPAGLAAPVFFGLICLAARLRTPELARSVWRAQRRPVLAWLLVGLIATTILHMGASGSGAWEPAYRFAPAIWSSDHTLPMVLAEVARIGVLPQEGSVGGWSLSDRPPLLAGAYLLWADLFALLQANNDGLHLQPIVLGVGGIAACSIWAASFYWAARKAAGLNPRIAAIAVAVVAATPFALFNTAYTWPKLFGAAFSLAAAAYVFRRRAQASAAEAASFGALGAFAMLSHAASAFFLAPVSLIYFATRLWRSPKALVVGAATGLVLLASWSAFKLTVLPSHDPLLGYALTGEVSFEAEPLGERLAERYRDLGLGDWIATKAEVGAYLFTPQPVRGPTPLERPPKTPQADWASKLRFWDFYALSAGNLALLMLGLSAVAGGFAVRRGAPAAPMARQLILAAGGCYLLFVGVTFLPIFIHQFSYDAILAMALAGSILLGASRQTQRLLPALFLASAAYTLLVWVTLPLREARAIDLSAVAALVLLIAALAFEVVRPGTTIGWRRTVLAALLVAIAVGALLYWRPTGHILERAPQAPRNACTGSFDGVIQRRDGSWRAYGWAWDAAANAPPPSVRVLDGAGVQLGLAVTGGERADVPAVIPEVTDTRTGWSFALSHRPAMLHAVAVLANGAECSLGGITP
jgi:hypothetical protein